jgi:hypothetical protein
MSPQAKSIPWKNCLPTRTTCALRGNEICKSRICVIGVQLRLGQAVSFRPESRWSRDEVEKSGSQLRSLYNCRPDFSARCARSK